MVVPLSSNPINAAWFVATKLQPPLLRSDTIPRPHLEEALARSVSELPLTLLSAPAGYGKTTLLATLPRLLPDRPLAWVTLDAEENDPSRFLGLLASALQRLHPACGQSAWPWLTGGAVEATALKRGVAALIGDILTHLPDPVILVLDDLHFVTEPAVYIALEYLLDHQPPQLRLAVGTRSDPPLRLARLAARRQLGELRRPDLGFRPEEAQALLNGTLDLRLTTEEVAVLQERTEGWPAGLCLLAGPLGRLGHDRSQFMAALSHTERYAFEFLAEEVLRDLEPDLRLFLMQTAILPEMTPSLCQAVTGRQDAADLLEALYRQNLTIAALSTSNENGGADEPVYRHHALFARLLTRQLERERSGEIPELHRRAARAQTTTGRAIGHYLTAGLWAEAAALMIQVGPEMLHRGMTESLRTWHSTIPDTVRADFPRLSALLGRCEIHRGDFVAAGALLRQALERAVAGGDREGECEALISLITVSYAVDDRTSAAGYVERILALPLNPMSQVAPRLASAWLRLAESDWEGIRADIADGLGIIHQTGNRVADLIGTTYLSAPLLAVPGCLELVERYCAGAAARSLPETAWRMGADELSVWPLLWRGQIDAALPRAESVEALRQSLGGHPYIGVDVAVQLNLLHLARGDREGAEQAAERLVRRLDGAGASKWMFHLHAAARAMALLGRRAEAQAIAQRLAALPVGMPLTQYLVLHLTGLLALLEQRPAEAADALAEAIGLEERLPIAHVSGSARLLMARLRLEQGQPDQALALAEPVLAGWLAASRPGFALIDGPAGLPVLRLAAGRGLAGVNRLLALFHLPEAASVPEAPPSVVGAREPFDPLTQREQDVLRLIVAGRTNRQIGETLYITEETVKSHVAHILRKLDVTSRTQAAMRGRELGF